MKNLFQYHYSVSEAFFKYVRGQISGTQLVVELERIQDHARTRQGAEPEGLFKFHLPRNGHASFMEISCIKEVVCSEDQEKIDQLKRTFERFYALGNDPEVYFS